MPRRHRQRPTPQWMLATQSGLGNGIVERLRTDAPDSRPQLESDGRSDLIVTTGDTPPDAVELGAEDLFVLVGDAPVKHSAAATAAALYDPARWQQRLSVAGDHGVRIGATTGFRVIARVRSEASFKRTELRDALIGQVQRWRPRWRIADPAALELWVLETRPGHVRLAARMSSSETRQRGGREVERPGALRPVVAAAMVAEAGPPRGTLVDPFCGSGTILIEALAAGWTAAGTDIDAGAVRAAHANAPAAAVERRSVTDLAYPDGTIQAVVSNLPFGKQHRPDTGTLADGDWWDRVLRELDRITDDEAKIVLLHPGGGEFGKALRRSRFRAERGATVTTLGQRATIWRLRRRRDATEPP